MKKEITQWWIRWAVLAGSALFSLAIVGVVWVRWNPPWWARFPLILVVSISFWILVPLFDVLGYRLMNRNHLFSSTMRELKSRRRILRKIRDSEYDFVRTIISNN